MHHKERLDGAAAPNVLVFRQKMKERPRQKKGLDLLMPKTGEEDFRLVLLHEEIGWLDSWLGRGMPGRFYLRDPIMRNGWLAKTFDGKVGAFKVGELKRPHAQVEFATLRLLIHQENLPNTYEGALALQELAKQFQQP